MELRSFNKFDTFVFIPTRLISVVLYCTYFLCILIFLFEILLSVRLRFNSYCHMRKINSNIVKRMRIFFISPRDDFSHLDAPSCERGISLFRNIERSAGKRNGDSK